MRELVITFHRHIRVNMGMKSTLKNDRKTDDLVPEFY